MDIRAVLQKRSADDLYVLFLSSGRICMLPDAISKELYDWLLKQQYADSKFVTAPDLSLCLTELRNVCEQLDCEVEETGLRGLSHR